ncbi:MAG: CNNM domain-containing protein [Planctomycetaceae bacterium]
MSEFADSLPIWLPGLIAMLLLIVASAFFSASETAFFFLSREQVRKFSTGPPRQRMVASLLADPDRLLSAVLFWNLLINLSYFAVGIVIIHKLTTREFSSVAAVFGVANLLGIIVVGEVMPKSVAVVYRLQVAQLASWPLAVAVAALDPVIPWLGRFARVLRRTFWPHLKQEASLHAEDLEKAVDTSAALSSEILQIEQQVLHNILDLNELYVEEVMRPRSHCVSVAADGTLAALNTSLKHVNYLMVTDPDTGVFTGAISLNGISAESGQTFQQIAEPVIYVPWCASVAYVLGELQNKFRGVAVVVHEHGEVVGTATYEDLLESMLSEAPSRTRRMLRREPIIEIGDNRFHVEGLITLRYLARRLRIALNPEDESLYTLSGLFHDELERLPEVGDRIHWHGWVLTAINVTARGQVRVLVEPASLVMAAEQEGADS